MIFMNEFKIYLLKNLEKWKVCIHYDLAMRYIVYISIYTLSTVQMNKLDQAYAENKSLKHVEGNKLLAIGYTQCDEFMYLSRYSKITHTQKLRKNTCLHQRAML